MTNFKEKFNTATLAVATGVTTALMCNPVFADEVSVSDTLLTSFSSGVDEIRSLLLGIVGIVMSIIVLKLAFKSGVSFFKSSATK